MSGPWLDCSRTDRRLHRHKIVHGKGQGFFLNIVLGVVGALIGGWLFRFFGETGLTGFTLYSMFVAIIGAVIVFLAYHAFRRVAE